MTAVTKRKTGRKIDARKYGHLLAETLPRPIETEAEYERALEIINRLMSKPESKLTSEEDVLLELLSQLVERYEDRHYPIPDAPPHAVIQFLMEDRGLQHKDLMPVLGSRGVTSEVINGKRKPSKSQVKALAEFFKLPPELFLSLD
jgi:HTH-type transcriptional regulator/antitoxin HigA